MDEIKNVYRRMDDRPLYVKDDGSVSSALFLDSNGVSVNVDAGRGIEDIVKDEERLHLFYNAKALNAGRKLKAVISVAKEVCVEREIKIVPAPILGENEYHAILTRNTGEKTLTHGQRKHMASKCNVVKQYF